MTFEAILEAMSHSTRRRILALLEDGRVMSMSEISGALVVAPSSLTWHAKILEEAGLLCRTHRGKEVLVESTCSDVEIVVHPRRACLD